MDKIILLKAATAAMNSSKDVCIETAKKLMERPDKMRDEMVDPDAWLEKAAQYAWGFGRPEGWGPSEDMYYPDCLPTGCGRQDMNCSDCKETRIKPEKAHTCGNCGKKRHDSRTRWCEKIDNVICNECCEALADGTCDCVHKPKEERHEIRVDDAKA
jgi:hypothetical protein